VRGQCRRPPQPARSEFLKETLASRQIGDLGCQAFDTENRGAFLLIVGGCVRLTKNDYSLARGAIFFQFGLWLLLCPDAAK